MHHLYFLIVFESDISGELQCVGLRQHVQDTTTLGRCIRYTIPQLISNLWIQKSENPFRNQFMLDFLFLKNN